MEKIIKRWYDMIRINSINGHEVSLADYIAEELRQMGLDPNYCYFPEDEEEKARPSIWTVLDSGKPGKTMMLIGHLDTVSVAEGITADYAIMAEYRYDNVAIGFRGRYSFEVNVHGKAAHASHYPEVGENALITAGKLIASIEALPTLTHPHLEHGTWCVRYIEGGNPGTLVVPDNCYIFVDRYVVPGEDDKSCIDQILGAAKELGIEDKVDVRLKPRVSPYMQSFALEEDDYLVTTLQEKCKEVIGEDLPVVYDKSVCDSNILAVSLGIPTITFGPSGGGMHAANEYGYTYQVKNCAEIYKLTVAEMLK